MGVNRAARRPHDHLRACKSAVVSSEQSGETTALFYWGIMTSKVVVNTKKLNSILKSVDGDVGKVIRSMGFAVERKAKMLAPVDTGALRSSIYTRTPDGHQMPDVATDSARVPLPKSKSKIGVTVGPSVEYGVFVEFGTTTKAAQPYLTPAIRDVTINFEHFAGDLGKAVSGG